MGWVYAWNQVCIYMKSGYFSTGWIAVTTMKTMSKKEKKRMILLSGNMAALQNSSCVNLDKNTEISQGEKIVQDEGMDIWFGHQDRLILCKGGDQIKQNGVDGTLTFDAWEDFLGGAAHCEGPQGSE